MSNLRRYYVSGQIYFVTNVTFQRIPILVDNIDLFWTAIKKAKVDKGFQLISWVILPEHFHAMIRPKNTNLSIILKSVKQSFSMNFRKRNPLHQGKVWQNRFWDHIIRDQEDFNKHFDYIHFNPVKHGMTSIPFEYSHSSIHKFKEYYSPDWGIQEDELITGEFGE